MPKEQYGTDSCEPQTSIADDLLASSLPARSGSYRSLSAKRPRDPSHRKSVSFNDVPIVHEVPSHDAMRNSNCDTYRSWTYTDATPSTSVIVSPFYTSQILSPFNSTNTTAQKFHANRLSSAFYSSSSGTIPSRLSEWTIRNRSSKPTTTTTAAPEETTTTTSGDHTTVSWNPPTIVVHPPDERTTKDTTLKSNNSNAATHQPPPPLLQPPPVASENGEEKKFPYRSPLIPESEHHRTLPFTYGPFSDSTTTYTSILSANLTSSSSNHSSSNDTINNNNNNIHTRTARARSATLPISVTHSSRVNDSISITPFRTTTGAFLPNGSILASTSRTVLRPTTIAFQCTQQPSTSSLINGSSNTMSTTNTITTTTTGTNSTKPPIVPSRYGSSAAAAAAAHSRFVLHTNRPVTSTASTIKYAFAHPAMDSSMPIAMTPQTSIPRPPPTAFPRSRSANVLSSRRNVPSPMTDGSTTTTTTNQGTNNLYSTTKRNPNVRQTYGSYYMHRVLLPTTTN